MLRLRQEECHQVSFLDQLDALKMNANPSSGSWFRCARWRSGQEGTISVLKQRF